MTACVVARPSAVRDAITETRVRVAAVIGIRSRAGLLALADDPMREV
jgi:hypothetical protein